MTRRRNSPVATWLAIASMVLNAAWPLLANAKPAVPASPSEICSASGHTAGGAPAAPDKGVHASHCSFCPFGAERSAAIPYARQAPLAPVCAQAPALARGDAPPQAAAFYAAAPPRAPPFSL